jgi:hypothetical protein
MRSVEKPMREDSGNRNLDAIIQFQNLEQKERIDRKEA